MGCRLMVMHDEQGLLHWYGVKEHNIDFSIDVFDSTLHLDEAQDLTGDLGTIDLVAKI